MPPRQNIAVRYLINLFARHTQWRRKVVIDVTKPIMRCFVLGISAVISVAIADGAATADGYGGNANSSSNSSRHYKFGAIYFGDWHVDPVMSSLHGPNWTEWSLVTHAQPRYEGHLQPNIPLDTPGFGPKYPENIAANMALKIDKAKDAGVDYFMFDW